MTDFFQKSRIVSCFFFSFCSYCLAQEVYPRKIGVVLPLSGLAVSSGTSIKNSIELALEENSSAQVNFVFEDDQFDPKNTLTAVRKLIDTNHVDGLLVWGTPTSLAVNNLSEKAKVPLVAFSMIDKVVEGKSFVMKHWLPARFINENVSNELIKRGIKTVSLVVQLNDSMLKLKDHFLERNAAKVLSSVEYPREETDFKTQAVKIKALNPDGVYLLLWAPQVGLFSKQLRAVGYKGALFGVQNMEDKNEITQAEGAMENAWFLGTDDTQASEFNQRYKEKYNSAPVAGGSNAYDVAKIIISCSTAKDLNYCLHTIKNFKGALGTYSATDRNDFNLKPLLKCVRNGEISASGC